MRLKAAPYGGPLGKELRWVCETGRWRDEGIKGSSSFLWNKLVVTLKAQGTTVTTDCGGIVTSKLRAKTHVLMVTRMIHAAFPSQSACRCAHLACHSTCSQWMRSFPIAP